jgi:Stage II sporulation protein E (SpoIIE)
MFFWLFLRRYPYFRTLPLEKLRDLFLAFFFSWSVFGFLIHLLMLDSFPSRSVGLYWAAFAGGLAVLYFLVTMKDARFIPVLGLLQAGLFIMFLSPSFSWSILNQRIIVDVVGIGIVTLLGFNFFGSFINTSGLEQVKIQTELALAQTMQTTVVPPIQFRMARWEVYGKSVPSDKVGGDLVDAIAEDANLFVYVADVSGHGIRASVLMGMVKTAVRVSLHFRQEPVAFLDAMNRVLPSVKEPGMFATLAYLRLAEGTDEVEYALAGHPCILHYRHQNKESRHLGAYQLPLGILPATYETARVTASAGDIFAIVSDGFTELTNRKDQEFGLDGLEELITRNATRRLPEIFDVVAREAALHGKQQDDQTLLLVRITR